MIYEYDNSELSKEEIITLLEEAKTPSKTIKNVLCYLLTIIVGSMILISFIYNNYEWNYVNNILVVIELIGVGKIKLKKE